MARRIQFRLRAIFYATAMAAVLCVILPPLFRVAQLYFAAKRPLPKPVRVEIISDSLRVKISSDLSAIGQEPTNIEVLPTIPGPTDATFIMTTITRVNGKRVDASDDAQDEQLNTRPPE